MRKLVLLFACCVGLVGCGAGLGLAGAPAEPRDGVGIALRAGDEIPAGSLVDFSYTGGQEHGLRHLLQRWDGSEWKTEYQVAASDPDDPESGSAAALRAAWSEASETLAVPDVRFPGDAVHRFAVPEEALGGAYRLCDGSGTHCSATFYVP